MTADVKVYRDNREDLGLIKLFLKNINREKGSIKLNRIK